MKKALIFTGFGLLFSLAAGASTHRADFYPQGETQGAKLYTSEAVILPAEGGGELETLTYKDPEGNVAVEEKYWLDGTQLKKAEIQQKQLGQSAVVEVKDGRVYFEKTADGKTKKSDEKKEDTFVMSGNFQRFVRDHWADLAGGKTVNFRFGVWDRMETIGFDVVKTGEGEFMGQKTIILKMRPSSFLLSALVKPLQFHFAADGSKLLRSSGRIAPKQKSGGGWKDLDAEAVYLYEDAAAAAKK